MIKKEDTQKLVKSGVLSKNALAEMEKTNVIAKSRTTVKRFMKTADGKFVEPSLYFRGGKGCKPSKKMVEFTNEYQKLLDKYTTKAKSK